MLHLLDVVFEYWSPSKEIKHQLDTQETFMSLEMMKYNMHPSLRGSYVQDLYKIEPVLFESFFAKRIYQQFIIFFHDELLDGKTFKEALAEVKNDRVWYG